MLQALGQSLLAGIWLIPLYSLVGAILSLIWAPSVTRRTGPRPAGYVNILMTFISFLHGCLVLPSLWDGTTLHLEWEWFHVAGLTFPIVIEVSALTVGITVLITGLNLLAQVFAVGYMEMDWGWARFYAMLAFFESGMCALAFSDSLFFAYVILEILTLGTYLLIGVWYNQPLVVTGARDAFLTKRVGDLFLLMGVVAILPLAGTWDFDQLAGWAATAEVDPTVITLVGLGLLAGPMGKCAQFPLHLWLDEAMEGPIPATILRNSVVVATGAWVLIKLQPIFSMSPVVQAVTIAIGAATALGATLIAIAQIDIKRVLSYSVSAYMGLVFIAVGTGHVPEALMLILTHGMGQAVLVMSVGAVIVNCITQDVTLLGGLFSRRPITALSFLVGAWGMVGLPPLGTSWVFQKLVSELWYEQRGLAFLILIVNALTAFSLIRLFGLIFLGKPKQMTERSPEPLWLIVMPMTIGAGVTLHVPQMLAQWQLIDDWSVFVQHSGIAVTVSSLLGAGLAYYLYGNEVIPKPIKLPSLELQNFFAYDFYTPKLYRATVVGLVDIFSRIADWCDRYIVDGASNLFGLATILSGESLKYTTFGQLQAYVLTLVAGVVVLFLLLR
ncbi:MAG: NAD(P)H-quinone oxidoreductase subunit F [Pseudanabaenaceae cyanobacterium]